MAKRERESGAGWHGRRWLLVGLAPAAALLLSRPAAAHAVLEASSPAPGSSVPAGKVDFRLRYNSRIDAGRSQLRLDGPGASHQVLAIDRGAAPNLLVTSATLAAGAYVLHWLVLAIDGHITQGEVAFTVRAP